MGRPQACAAIRGLLIVCATAAVLLAGCAAGEPAWGERTRNLNRIYHLDGRDDRRIVYRDTETPDAPLTLLFVHGLASSKATWQYITPGFEHEYRVVLIDLLGHGDSSKPDDYEYSMSAQGDLLRKFILERGLRDVVVIGASYGGGSSLEAVLPLYWGGQGKRVRGIVLLAATGLDFAPPESYKLARCPPLRGLALVFGSPEGFARALLKEVFWRDDRIPEVLVREYARVYHESGAVRVAFQAGIEIFDELRARRRDPQRYAAIGCPVLLLRGDHDRVVPADVAERLAAVLPHAEVKVIADCGHAPQEEQPEETATAIRGFIADCLRGEPSTSRAAGASQSK
jgi:pimeloyl-ACP methyl ester carboxylesterase